MSAMDRIERRLPDLLDELAVTRTPDYFDDILGQVDRTRQRPGWTFLERWLPMTTLTDRMTAVPRHSWRLAFALVVLLLALILGTALLVGTRAPEPLAPYGVADNGLIAFVDEAGAIQVLDPSDGTATTVVPGPGNARPVFSPDGQRIAWIHDSAAGMEIVVADAPGGDAATTVITPEPYGAIGYLGWSPDGTRIAAAIDGQMMAFGASAAGEPTALTANVRNAGSFGSLDAFNTTLSSVFRPPSGDEVAYLGTEVDAAGVYQFGLYRRSLADGDPVAILVPGGAVDFLDLASPQWSPDGSRIAVTVRESVAGGDWRVYVMDADGSGIKRLTDLELADQTVSEAWPMWSPDGTDIAIMRWFNASDGGVDVRPVTVVDVATGAEREVGTVNVNGYVMWGWSPDGASILEVPAEPSEDADHLLIVDAATGDVDRTGIATLDAPSWQRTP